MIIRQLFASGGKLMRTNEEQVEVYKWQEKKIRKRLKKSEKGGKFLTSDQVNKIVESFEPGSPIEIKDSKKVSHLQLFSIMKN